MNTGSLRTVLEGGQPVAGHRPWPRVVVTTDTWNALVEGLAGDAWTLLGLWGEPGMVHLAACEAQLNPPQPPFEKGGSAKCWGI